MDEDAIRAVIRQKLREGWPPTRTGLYKEVGPSDRGQCSACGREISDAYQVRIVYVAGPTLRMHFECESIWRNEVQ